MKKFLTTKELIICALFAALTAICTQISIPLPFTPIPFTMQLFSVSLAAIILGPKLSFISQLTYVLIGAIGVPVFSFMSGGLQKLAGPTGGYIISFPIAVLIVGYFTSESKRLPVKILGSLLGLASIYAIGTIQLSIVANMDFSKALFAGVIPFIPLDLVKLSLSLIVGLQVRKALVKSSLLPSIN